MPIEQIAPIVRVQQAKLEKERHDIETVLQGQISKIWYELINNLFQRY